MIPWVLIRLYLLASLKNPLRLCLMVLGIALGVASVIAVDIAKTSVSKSFELSSSALTARTTHQIKGSQFQIAQAIFTQIRTGLGIARSAPVISTHVKVKELESRVMTLMGIDPFSETRFRNLTVQAQSKPSDPGLSGLLTNSVGVLVSKSHALQYNLKQGDFLTLLFGKREKKTIIAGFLDTDNFESAKVFNGVILADISLAQEILEMGDNISRIDLVLNNPFQAEQVRNILPKGVLLVETSQQDRVVRSLSTSFETSLTAFSMLALFMGIFLIYNTISFSIARLRKLNGILRALGASPGNIFGAVMIEVIIYAFAGSVLGILMGAALGNVVVKAVCSTVSDIYFVLTVSQFSIVGSTVLKGFLAGILSSVLAAFFPAMSAARIQPITLMQRSASETALTEHYSGLCFAGLGIITIALVLVSAGAGPLGSEYIAVFLAFFGYALLAPVFIILLIKGLVIVSAPFASLIVKMALRNIVRSLSRTSVLVASLSVVTSVYIGIDIMTDSFRFSIADWVDGNIGGDIHVSSVDDIHRSLDPGFVKNIGRLPEVKDVLAYNIHRIFSQASGEVHVFSYVRDFSKRKWSWTANDTAQLDYLLENGWIYVSEIFAQKNKIKPQTGASVVLETLLGPKSFKIAGIFQDYFMGGGRVIVSPGLMKACWGHDDVTAVQVFLDPDAPVKPAIDRIRQLIPESSMIRVVSGKSIKQSILAVFDRTFLITSALQILTALVALTGILNSFMALLLERTREMGILRACGGEKHQVFRLLLWECGLCGFASGIMALPLGAWLAWVLVHIVNFRSFGWSYEIIFSSWVFVQAPALAVIAAVFAGIYPGITACRIDVGNALKME